VNGYLFNKEKYKYVNGCKPHVECILCSIRDRDPDVALLEIARTDLAVATVNLYPFNPGHLMIFPLRHCVDICELTNDEALRYLHRRRGRQLHSSPAQELRGSGRHPRAAAPTR